MGREFEGVREYAVGALKTAATVLLLGVILAAGERSLAPLMMQRPDDRKPADVRVTDAVYRYTVSYAIQPDLLQEPLKEI